MNDEPIVIDWTRGKKRQTGKLARRHWVRFAKRPLPDRFYVPRHARRRESEESRLFRTSRRLLADWGKEIQREEIFAVLRSLPSSPTEALGLQGASA